MTLEKEAEHKALKWDPANIERRTLYSLLSALKLGTETRDGTF